MGRLVSAPLICYAFYINLWAWFGWCSLGVVSYLGVDGGCGQCPGNGFLNPEVYEKNGIFTLLPLRKF